MPQQLNENLRPMLQRRWELREFGKQSKLIRFAVPNFDEACESRHRPVSALTAKVIGAFDGDKNLEAIIAEQATRGRARCEKELGELIESGLVVDAKDRKKQTTKETQQTCTRCGINDYVFPGLDFNGDGLCACCQFFDVSRKSKISTLVPDLDTMLVSEEMLRQKAKQNSNRFDVMVLLTGGKDSSYLLWYVAKKLGLRVMACVWEMPFNSESANRNIEKLKEKLPNVEFVCWKVAFDSYRNAASNVFKWQGTPCCCPQIAEWLFFPLAYGQSVPYILNGLELVQYLRIVLQMYSAAPMMVSQAMSGTLPWHLKLALKLKQLFDFSSERSRVTQRLIVPSHEWNEILRNSIPGIIEPVQMIVKHGARSRIPKRRILVKQFNPEMTWEEAAKVTVFPNWREVRDTLETELDWEMPEGQQGLLHTSCVAEPVQEFGHSCCARYEGAPFYPPQFTSDLCAAVNFGQTTRQAAMEELEEKGCWDKVPEQMETVTSLLGVQMEESDFYRDRILAN